MPTDSFRCGMTYLRPTYVGAPIFDTDRYWALRADDKGGDFRATLGTNAAAQLNSASEIHPISVSRVFRITETYILLLDIGTIMVILSNSFSRLPIEGSEKSRHIIRIRNLVRQAISRRLSGILLGYHIDKKYRKQSSSGNPNARRSRSLVRTSKNDPSGPMVNISQSSTIY